MNEKRYTLTPKMWSRRKRPLDRPPPTDDEKRSPMKWHLDPASPAADALRELKRSLVNIENGNVKTE